MPHDGTKRLDIRRLSVRNSFSIQPHRRYIASIVYLYGKNLSVVKNQLCGFNFNAISLLRGCWSQLNYRNTGFIDRRDKGFQPLSLTVKIDRCILIFRHLTHPVRDLHVTSADLLSNRENPIQRLMNESPCVTMTLKCHSRSPLPIYIQWVCTIHCSSPCSADVKQRCSPSITVVGF